MRKAGTNDTVYLNLSLFMFSFVSLDDNIHVFYFIHSFISLFIRLFGEDFCYDSVVYKCFVAKSNRFESHKWIIIDALIIKTVIIRKTVSKKEWIQIT